MRPFVELELSLHGTDPSCCNVGMRLVTPDDLGDRRLDEPNPPKADLGAALVARLQEFPLDPKIHGEVLTRALFASEATRTFFRDALNKAHDLQTPLRFGLVIPRNLSSLDSLCWEALRDPQTMEPLTTRDDIQFFRYLPVRGVRPIRPLSAGHRISSLVVIANGANLDQQMPGHRTRPLAAVPVADELRRAREGLRGTQIIELATRGQATLDNLALELRKGRELLYLVCHGAVFGKETILYLENESGGVHRVRGDDFIAVFRGLTDQPRLVVLVACETAGKGEPVTSEDDGAFLGLGPRLVEAGIPAVLAMRGKLFIRTVEEFMPTFFEVLFAPGGTAEAAVAAARYRVRKRNDAYVPVLFSRLRTGTLLDPPAETGGALARSMTEVWPELVPTRRKRGTPLTSNANNHKKDPSGILNHLILTLFDIRGWRTFIKDHYPGLLDLMHMTGSLEEIIIEDVAVLDRSGFLDAAFFSNLAVEYPQRVDFISKCKGEIIDQLRTSKALNDAKRMIKHQVKERTDILASLFRVAGGPETISEVFVEVLLDGSDRRGPRSELLSMGHFRIEKLLTSTHKRWVLLGEPGAGKTTLVTSFARSINDGSLDDAGQFDLLAISLRAQDLVQHDKTIFEVIASSYRLDRETISCLVQISLNGELVLIIDGLDEAVDMAAARDSIIAAGARLSHCHIIVTSRRVGYQRPSPSFAEALLLPLSKKSQTKLLSAWVKDENLVEMAIGSLHRNSRMRRLAENPLLLTLIGLTLCEGHDLPRKRADLYALVTEVLLRRRHTDETSIRRIRNPSLVRKCLCLLALSAHLRGNKDTCVFPRKQIDQLLQPMADEISKHFGCVDEFVDDIAILTGLLLPNSEIARAVGFSFPHRTLQEYFAGLAVVDTLREISGSIPSVPNTVLESMLPMLSGGPETRIEVNHSKYLAGSKYLRIREYLASAAQNPSLWSEVFALAIAMLSPPEADAFARLTVLSGSPELVARVLGDAEGISDKTVLAVLPKLQGSEDWIRFIDILPSLVGEFEAAINIVTRLKRTTRSLETLVSVRDRVLELPAFDWKEISVTKEDASLAAKDCAKLIYDHIPADDRLAAMREVRSMLVAIPPGKAVLGNIDAEDEFGDIIGPYRVVVKRRFWMSKYPVTNKILRYFDPGFEGAANYPATTLSVKAADLFAEWVGCRLPSADEWEYACRARSLARYHSGNSETDLAKVAWYGRARVQPVGRKQPNEWGLYDMHGNVWEWCIDIDPAYTARTQGGRQYILIDPAISYRSIFRTVHELIGEAILRGGSCADGAAKLRAAYELDPPYGGQGDQFTGFRLVRASLDEQE